ncbi:hypothetical protein BDI4_210056 [Burkholderia diffusa]|uniref:hypothetical protein n=1 Tax=Burkholderia diffusa TaxID=488732 RepID=UPI001CB546CC|nr:hypothetical protein [Burkholderia diffusa]CAG9247789.1 hypothetical protein BDI4_210056 [Burkholderia diffusa]
MSNIVSATPLDYALLTQRAYTSPPRIGVETNAARAIVEGDVLAFPGTNNLACWLADLDIETIGVPGLGALHADFWRALSSIRDALLALTPPAVVVGHREGAALAILFAAELCQVGHTPQAVYGFESPRERGQHARSLVCRARCTGSSVSSRRRHRATRTAPR